MNTEELWQGFLDGRNNDSRQEIIIHYMPIVKYIVHRLNVKTPHYFDEEDLYSYALMGLIEAVDKYNPNCGAKFETYASYRIRGSVLDHIRKANLLPRTVFKKIKALMEASQQLEQMGISPTDEKIASYAGMPISDYYTALIDISNLSCISLDETISLSSGEKYSAKDTIEAENSPNPEAIIEQQESSRLLQQGLEKLNDKDKLILALYYNEGLTLKEIGKTLNISESRVCQLHGRAILRLKKKLEELEYV